MSGDHRADHRADHRGARRGGRGEQTVVPDAEFESYYGRPIIKQPTWKTPDVPIYLFVGGAAGASALLAEGAALTDRPGLELAARSVAGVGATVGTVALIHDLGRPERFLNMLRVFKPTSPLSVGSYILAPFSALATAALASQVTGKLPRLGRLAGVGAAAFGPPLATYTAALIANTAVPVWHEAHQELPFVFGASGASAGGGLALLLAPSSEHGPALRMAVVGSVVELAVTARMEQRLGMLAEPYHQGLSGRLSQAARALTVGGVALTAVRRPAARRLGGALLAAGSLTLRFAVFEAGRASAKDPKYTVVPQRARVDAREATRQAEAEGRQPATS